MAAYGVCLFFVGLTAVCVAFYNSGMDERFTRSAMLVGEEGVARLKQKRVAVFGLGGVGGAAAEALARAGVGTLALVDGDVVSITNLNRQIIALESTIGQPKAQLMAERVLSINPEATVQAVAEYYTADTADGYDLSQFDHVLDCVDMVTAKLLLVHRCAQAGIPLISAMGAGNRLDPTLVRIGDITETRMCPLARVMRKQLKKQGVERLTVAWSAEEPTMPRWQEQVNGRHPPASMLFVPSAMGIAMASHVVRALLQLL